eukprot:TRINITY_DN503_c1_g1_i6.p1 TRINITY_DN503_c1_g1~~TRINITY_DN503_c1_g1_i6.p1  ORF type:complete len:245 (+),score=56.66 TRINITY_DN503_c1_g1_i6:259-993(+)
MALTYLITGASRGIGFEFVRQLSAANPNTVIFAGARNPAKALELQKLASTNHNIHILQFDVTSQVDIDNSVKEVERIAGGLDVLISNAGIGGNADLSKDKPADVVHAYKHTFETNLYAIINIDLAFIPLLRKRGTRKIINISSILGSIANLNEHVKFSSPYNTSKTALNMFTKHLSLELKDEGFIIAPLHPGWTDSELGDSYMPGVKAPVKLEDSVKGQIKVIDGLTKENNGEFLSFDGKVLSW